ncbi:hypothetical protein Y5W_03290 [Alcanivorax sp. 521-1]|uniref:Uncharacterized protein n=1 Tax=Alloalcanivorax profundimaris TaxID=2735259 RepID=A0ABS0AX04_9GAMM|nr:hypothetical protein [Alloalcanivorax profundimaris]MAO59234.1 hypothetical protein [Alcanivorax sp.]MCQ6262897.1 hypothetical protein [Alcanivorax sp. MM125-6]MAY11682.1 hypothetical protein [Alcanivorax sp.]MBF5057996.1 hypothetical protein [Alloalcanivorax profundimaris]MBI53098.1 hypothetical protein [Alcanivorax sp.]|tara:strand:- start:39696 stop:40001 length:306 start_codon:yes stop_codon:yes gene_type:complete
MAKPKYTPIRPDWWSKTLAGGLLGFTLGIALSGLFAWLGPGGIDAANKVQLVMWMVPVPWMITFSLVYLFPSGVHAWLWLGAANLAAFGLLLAARAGLAGG